MSRVEPALLAEMRAWIAECVWGDLEPEDVAELEACDVVAGIERNYAGGVTQFIRDGGVS